MASGDWIALGAAIVATVACVVAVITYRLQERTQAASDEQQLNELIEKIQVGLASLNKLSAITAVSLETFAASGVTLASLRGQALEARKLTKRPHIKPDWFQNMILAYAFTQVWDLADAKPYWDGAVTASSGGDTHPAHVSSLEARATFFYNRGLNDDWQLARKDFKTALDELRADPDKQGPDMAAQQVALMSFRQAAFELDAGGETAAAPLIADAFIAANTIGARWRKRNVLNVIGKLVLELQQKQGAPELLQKVVTELSQQDVGLDAFPGETAELLSLPPDGSLSLPPDGSLSLPPDGTLFASADHPADNAEQ